MRLLTLILVLLATFIQSSDRAHLKRQIVTVKEWKRQAEPIGHGQSGIIWLEHHADGKESRVVKQIIKATPTTPLQIDSRRELQALGLLSKDLFVHFYGWFENNTSIFLAMEYIELGDLEKFITPRLTEKDARIIGRQLLVGLQVLHGHHLAHRDLKPANIFVARGSPDWWIKLGGFRIVGRACTEHNTKLGRIGTLGYMAPETLLDNDNGEESSLYTLAVDIWSLGCVLFQLLTQQLPFPQQIHLQLYWQSRKPFPTDTLIKHSVSEDGVCLISKMMELNPGNRMTVNMALLHSWVSIQNSIIESPMTSHTGTRNIPHQFQELLPFNSRLASSQDEEVGQLQKSMLDKEERRLNPNDKDTDPLELKSDVAASYLELGQYQEAMHSYKKTIELQKRILGDEHPDTLCSMTGLAISYSKRGQDYEAMHLHKRTLELRKRILGDEHHDTLSSMDCLANSYLMYNQDKQAIHLCKQTLELRKRILGDEHLDTFFSINLLALSYIIVGYQNDINIFKQVRRQQKGVNLSKQTLELQKSTLGDEHPRTIASMQFLAIVYSLTRFKEEVMGLYKQLLELQKRIFGDEHPDTLRSMNSLAMSYLKLGQNQKAMHLGKQTLDLRKRILGDEHRDTLRSMDDLAQSYLKVGQDQEAMQLRKQTLELRKRILGDEHPNTLQSMNDLAQSYSKLGLYQEAKQLSKQAIEAQQRIFGPAHPRTTFFTQTLAKISRKEEARTKYPRGLSRYVQYLKR